ncbi:hypothetical protein GTR02_13230 [Kineococcus sp. R8]|uniref:MAB_1171c family putative transporter n=1 Tax=Kineococcus siccus TaxID=2696567 RepID=UPI0014126BCE|nr:MAB_1171c family putative transporter [Kineococcus siccus]NAZ82781.1 hypothetical protein [Kineococcus siccus]
MLDSLLPLIAAPLLLGALLRVRDLAPGRNSERRAVAVALLTFGTSVLLATPAIGDRLASTADVAQLDVLLCRLVSVLGVFAILRGFRLTLGPGQKRLPLAFDISLVALVMVTMVTSFSLEAVPDGGDLIIDRGHDPAVALFVASFSLYLGWCFTAILRGWRRLRRQPDLDARAGVQLTAMAAAAGLVYVLARLTGQVALLVTAPDALVETTRQVCLAAAVLAAGLLTAGACASGIVAVAARVSAEAVRAGQMVRLYPLWRDVVTAAPEVALTPQRFAPWRLVTCRTDFHLYRMVIEILDGRSLLLARAHGGVPEASSPDLDAETLAFVLDTARRGRHGQRAFPEMTSSTVGATVADETARLLAAAAEYRRLRRGRPLRMQLVRR